MPVTRLNHAVLYVRDVRASVDFYGGALGFRVVGGDLDRGSAFLQAGASSNDHDLGLFQVGSAAAPSSAGRGSVGLYHLAWEVDTLAELERLAVVMGERGALVGATDHGTTKSLYVQDPDGIESEIVWLLPADRITEADVAAKVRLRPLDLQAELDRFGADLRGGVGVSVPV